VPDVRKRDERETIRSAGERGCADSGENLRDSTNKRMGSKGDEGSVTLARGRENQKRGREKSGGRAT